MSSHLPLKSASWQHDPNLETCRVHISTVFSWIFLADHVTTTLARRSLVWMEGTLGFPSPHYITSSTFSKFSTAVTTYHIIAMGALFMVVDP
jgi:hypothetical protein